MQPSIFNVRVPLPTRDEVFLMNTLNDAQVIVSPDVAALLDRFDLDDSEPSSELDTEAREAIALLKENGFLVPSREHVLEYGQLKREIDETVGRVNGRFSERGWTRRPKRED